MAEGSDSITKISLIFKITHLVHIQHRLEQILIGITEIRYILRPKGILITREVLTLAGQHHGHQVHDVHAVGVRRQVGPRLHQKIKSLSHHFTPTPVLAIDILTIISLIAAQRDRPQDIKHRIELSVTLVEEVIMNATPSLIIRKTRLIEETLIIGRIVRKLPIVNALLAETNVSKLHHENNNPLRALSLDRSLRLRTQYSPTEYFRRRRHRSNYIRITISRQ